MRMGASSPTIWLRLGSADRLDGQAEISELHTLNVSLRFVPPFACGIRTWGRKHGTRVPVSVIEALYAARASYTLHSMDDVDDDGDGDATTTLDEFLAFLERVDDNHPGNPFLNATVSYEAGVFRFDLPGRNQRAPDDIRQQAELAASAEKEACVSKYSTILARLSAAVNQVPGAASLVDELASASTVFSGTKPRVGSAGRAEYRPEWFLEVVRICDHLHQPEDLASVVDSVIGLSLQPLLSQHLLSQDLRDLWLRHKVRGRGRESRAYKIDES